MCVLRGNSVKRVVRVGRTKPFRAPCELKSQQYLRAGVLRVLCFIPIIL